MYRSEEYLKRADNCAILAEQANTAPAKRRYRRMEEAWQALAAEQRWLDGEVSPQGGLLAFINAPAYANEHACLVGDVTAMGPD